MLVPATPQSNVDDFETRLRHDARGVRGNALQKEIIAAFVFDQHEVEHS
jgi:hypothetical protein